MRPYHLERRKTPFRENKWASYCQLAIEREIIQEDCIPILQADDNIYKLTPFYDITRGKYEVLSVQTKAD